MDLIIPNRKSTQADTEANLKGIIAHLHHQYREEEKISDHMMQKFTGPTVPEQRNSTMPIPLSLLTFRR